MAGKCLCEPLFPVGSAETHNGLKSNPQNSKLNNYATLINQNIQSIGNRVNAMANLLKDYPNTLFLTISEHWKSSDYVSAFERKDLNMLAEKYVFECACTDYVDQSVRSTVIVTLCRSQILVSMTFWKSWRRCLQNWCRRI